ncbi:NnrT protein [Rhodobacterales bacterium 56_14_T64]|nr:NnrT protein [Rhodobacterales bacterium 56_14_T64]
MSQGWSKAKLTLVLYPFGAGAAAVNIFFASLITSWIGWPVLPPEVSIVIGMVLGVPLTYAFACHIHKLMQQ